MINSTPYDKTKKEVDIMEEITMYKANDGKLFDDVNDCIEYEFELFGKRLKNDLLMFDENHEQIKLSVDTNYNLVHYVVLKTKDAFDYFIERNITLELSIDGISYLGAYYYNTYSYEWELVADKVEDLQNELDLYNKYLNL